VADYSHLKKLDVTDASEAEYVFSDVAVGRNEDGSVINPTIFFRPMIDSNRHYLNERIRLSTERAEQTAAADKKDKVQQLADRLNADRDADRVLISRTCALRWGVAPKDIDGKEHEFSPDECLAFRTALPNYMFDPLRSWVQNPYNFVDPEAYRTGGGIVDPETLGNS
jgi:hypothetical protein